MSKQFHRAYRSGRSRDWLKTECVLADAFVIIGYQPGAAQFAHRWQKIGISRFDGGRLRYAGDVGTGSSERVAAALRERLDLIKTPACAGRAEGRQRGVCRHLYALIAYRDVTTAGELRHASFKKLRK